MSEGGDLNANNLSEFSHQDIENFFNTPYVILTYTLCYGIAVWTVVMHSLILVCFVINRRASWMQKTKGILSLVLTDLGSGIGFMFLVFAQTHIKVDLYACTIPLGNYMTTQLATNLQVLRICVQRCIAVLSSTQRQAEGTLLTVVQFIIIYLLSFAVNAICLKWITVKPVYVVCNLQTLVEDNLQAICIFMLIVLSVPTFASTTIYFIIIQVLRRKSRAVAPVLAVTTHSATGSNDGSSSDTRPSDQRTTAVKKYMSKALTTIGLVLLLNNFALFPFFLTLTYHVFYPGNVASIYIWFGSALALQTNSALSPFVYCLRVKALSKAFKAMITCKVKT